MNHSDPFQDYVGGNQTIVRPRPAGKQAWEPQAEPSPPASRDKLDVSILSNGNNEPLISHSRSLLYLAPEIRNLAVYQDIDGLFMKLVNEVETFRDSVIRAGVSESNARTASMFLCALLDEAILNTPWGSQSNWKHRNLSSQFFNLASLGTRFFEEMEKMKLQSRKNIGLLKLAYVSLSLGFQGQFRTRGDGLRLLEDARNELYHIIIDANGETESGLSIRWKGIPMENPLVRHIPLWVVSSFTVFFLLICYAGFLYAVSNSSEIQIPPHQPLAISLEEVKAPRSLPVSAEDPPPLPEIVNHSDRFRKLLEKEISLNLVKVLDNPPVTIRISNAFLSGKAAIKPNLHSILEKIAHEIKDDDDDTDILITGHSDNQKIRFSLLYPDNLKLSLARAESAAKIIENAGSSLASRLRFEGKSDWEPIVDNDTKEHRAINRRIDLLIR